MLIPIPIPQYGIGIVISVDVHFWNFLVCFLSRRAKSIGIGRILQNPLESYVFRLQASRPQVEKYGPVPAGKHRKSTERGSSIPVGNFSDFFLESSDQFLFIPAGNGRKSSGKKPKQFPAGILLPFSVDFQSFPAGTGDFPASSCSIR